MHSPLVESERRGAPRLVLYEVSGDNVDVVEIPKKALTRGVKMAALPAAYAGRTAWGVGKRLGGKPAEAVAAEIQLRTAEQMFKTLGELKGGAMKVGQAMSIFEAALPEEVAGPYRAALTKLQEAAPPMPAARIHAILAEELGSDWRDLFIEFDDTPAAAASIGQVHRAVWSDGRPVAVKVQYPGADKALVADLNQMVRLGKMFSAVVPGVDIADLVDELRDRAVEELDYLREAQNQAQFAEAFADDPDFVIPQVLASAPHVLVGEWIEGTPLARIIADGTPEQRDNAGSRYITFLLAGPARAGLLHADPHPGNYRVVPDGRLAVLDFGAVARLPEGIPPDLGTLLRVAQYRDVDTIIPGLYREGFLREGVEVDPQALVNYFDPLVEPTRHPTFHFTRAWLRSEFLRLSDINNPDNLIGMKLNLPPEYALIHRVLAGGIAVLCQIEGTVPMRSTLEEWLPGFAEPEAEQQVGVAEQ